MFKTFEQKETFVWAYERFVLFWHMKNMDTTDLLLLVYKKS